MSFTKHSRFSAVQRSRVPVMAHVIFLFFPVNNALSPSRADARETVQFRQSHVIRSPPMKQMKRRTLTIGT